MHRLQAAPDKPLRRLIFMRCPPPRDLSQSRGHGCHAAHSAAHAPQASREDLNIHQIAASLAQSKFTAFTQINVSSKPTVPKYPLINKHKVLDLSLLIPSFKVLFRELVREWSGNPSESHPTELAGDSRKRHHRVPGPRTALLQSPWVGTGGLLGSAPPRSSAICICADPAAGRATWKSVCPRHW